MKHVHCKWFITNILLLLFKIKTYLLMPMVIYDLVPYCVYGRTNSVITWSPYFQCDHWSIKNTSFNVIVPHVLAISFHFNCIDDDNTMCLPHAHLLLSVHCIWNFKSIKQSNWINNHFNTLLVTFYKPQNVNCKLKMLYPHMNYRLQTGQLLDQSMISF